MPHDTIVVDVEAMSQLGQNGHVATGNESMATRELGEVVIVVPVERRDLCKGGDREQMNKEQREVVGGRKGGGREGGREGGWREEGGKREGGREGGGKEVRVGGRRGRGRKRKRV